MAVRAAVGFLSALLFVGCPTATAAGEVFKCRLADGSVAFLDHPCPEAAQELAKPRFSDDDSGPAVGGAPITWGCGQEGTPATPEATARMPQAQTEMLTLALSGVALGAGKPSRPAFFDRSGTVHFCTSVDGDRESELAVTPDGRAYGKQDGKVEFFGGPSPVFRLRECNDRVLKCASDGNRRGMDRCVAESVCATPERVPGEAACCPQACVARFRELRLRGGGEIKSFDDALSDESCAGPVPGLNRPR
jgi:hypothetical protein